mmetsp:Transcript_21463/g.31133  ORF Transcript_21463/g.31133 Transcript_21463/m.31133 type:complete len:80 (+) Transcript_21463:146-385(+)
MAINECSNNKTIPQRNLTNTDEATIHPLLEIYFQQVCEAQGKHTKSLETHYHHVLPLQSLVACACHAYEETIPAGHGWL